MATTTTVSSNYAGKAAGEIIGAVFGTQAVGKISINAVLGKAIGDKIVQKMARGILNAVHTQGKIPLIQSNRLTDQKSELVLG